MEPFQEKDKDSARSMIQKSPVLERNGKNKLPSINDRAGAVPFADFKKFNKFQKRLNDYLGNLIENGYRESELELKFVNDDKTEFVQLEINRDERQVTCTYSGTWLKTRLEMLLEQHIQKDGSSGSSTYLHAFSAEKT